ncbi:MAG: NADPH-dependent oxidoreductase [Bacteroidales bacterium]|jgi:nitroreductase|nr:NADPH-dependent oxidoreductase [Bacteroidales bacterium]
MNSTIEILQNHRTIRSYTQQPISEQMLEQILRSAIQGSTTGNMQLYSIIVNRDEAIKKQIAPLHFNQKPVLEAPLILTFCADFNRFIQWCNYRNAPHGYDNMQCFSWAVVDAVIAAQNACIAAEAMGLGICYIGTVTYNVKPLKEIYHLPKYVVPIACITVGYPAENPPLTDRLPPEAVIHHETYQNYSETSINQFYKEKENSDLTKRLLLENQVDNLAQVFTQKRYTKKDNEYFAKEFTDFLKEQGFL